MKQFLKNKKDQIITPSANQKETKNIKIKDYTVYQTS